MNFEHTDQIAALKNGEDGVGAVVTVGHVQPGELPDEIHIPRKRLRS